MFLLKFLPIRSCLPAVCLWLCALLCCTRPATALEITFNGSNVTSQAAPLERNRTILVNVAALASPLGLHVQVADGEATIIDASGTAWKARNGFPFLEAGTHRLSLQAPVLRQGAALYLPLEATAELAGALLQYTPTEHVAHLTSSQASGEGKVDDWQSFTLDKPDDEAQTAAGSPSSLGVSVPSVLRLPNAHDSIQVSLSSGYLQGTGVGTQLTAEGRYLGANVRFSSVLTTASRRLPLQNTQFWWEDQETGKTVELGNFYSDLWGGVSGGRFAWRMGKDHQPALSVYLSAPFATGTHPVLALRDNFPVMRNAWVGGELASDGSQYLQGRLQTSRWSGLAYYRHLTTGSGNGVGGFISYDIGRGVGIYAEASHSTNRQERSDWRTVGLRLPLLRQMDLTLEQTYAQTNTTSNRAYAAILSLPLGPLRLVTRYQGRHATSLGLVSTAAVHGQQVQEMQTSVAYFVNPRLRLELQSYASNLHSGLRGEREELTTAYHLSNRTQFQVSTLFSHTLNSTQTRLHLEHQLNSNLALTAEYGLPSLLHNAQPGVAQQGFTFMLRTHWVTPTPTRGAELKGQVTDIAGVGMRSVSIRLNNYQTQTDANGYYIFRHVPAGSYELALVESSLPADYKAAQPSLLVSLVSQSRKQIPLKVLPLHTIAGHVYYEEENGSANTMKPLSGVAVSINGFVTATNKEGAFAFYNLEPGSHTIRLLAERLPDNVTLISPGEVVTQLPLDHSVSGLMFRLRKHEKETIFQELK